MDGKVRKVEIEYKNKDSSDYIVIEKAVQKLIVIIPVDDDIEE